MSADSPPGVIDTARLVGAGDLRAEDVVRAALDRIASLDSGLGCCLTLMADAALEAARELDRRRARGERPGPLAGVPIALKDNICVAGAPLTCGSRILEGYVPPYDATTVRRLREAGAVIVAKTNLDEFAMGSSTENSAFQVTRNPWDLERVPGGSSGGSAAAVAARLVPAALGSDTGGSVRQPAALCGVTALKPTYGRISRFGLVAFGSSLDQIGPFGTSVADVARLFEVLAGPDPNDSTSRPEPVAPFARGDGASGAGVEFDVSGAGGAPDAAGAAARAVAGMTIAFPEEILERPGLSPEVAAATRAAARLFESLGARIEPLDFPDVDAGIAAYYLICTAEASSNLARYDGIRYGARAGAADLYSLYATTRERGFGPEVKRRIMLGTYALSSGYYEAFYGRAMRARAALRRRFREIFRRADLILLPTSPTPAFKLGEKTADPLEMYLADVFTVFSNLTGGPALSIPGGFTRDGLPIGIQLAADDLGENTLFAAGEAFEAATGFNQRRPPIAGGIAAAGGNA